MKHVRLARGPAGSTVPTWRRSSNRSSDPRSLLGAWPTARSAKSPHSLSAKPVGVADRRGGAVSRRGAIEGSLSPVPRHAPIGTTYYCCLLEAIGVCLCSCHCRLPCTSCTRCSVPLLSPVPRHPSFSYCGCTAPPLSSSFLTPVADRLRLFLLVLLLRRRPLWPLRPLSLASSSPSSASR